MKANRNDICPCGSGRKYKKCCLQNEASVSLAAPSVDQLLEQAIVQHQAGQLDEAAKIYIAILTDHPKHMDAMHLLGVVCTQNGDYQTAIELIQGAIQLGGTHRDFFYNLGNALRGARRDVEAIEAYKHILKTAPQDVAALNNLGLAYRAAGQRSDALRCFERAFKQDPVDTDLIGNIGLVLSDMNRIDEAIQFYRKALSISPALPEVLNNLGSAQQNSGDTQAAVRSYQQALAYRPDYVEAHSNLIFSLDFVEQGGVALQQAERKRWSDKFLARISPYAQHENVRDPERKLRIGYLSPDFRHHSAGYAFSPLILDYDREHFDVYCYTNSPDVDDLTERFRQRATQWREVYGLSDKLAAQQIHADGIDILVDLAGHSHNNRLGIMAYRPAPIQASGWGHANGTGLATVDYLFSDPVYIPPAEAVFYREKILYLPCVIGYLARPDVALNTVLPATQNGYITFGSFSRLAKISPEVLALWGELLAKIGGSRIVFKAPELNSEGRRTDLLARMQACGVDASRVTLLAGTPWLEHVQAISTVDIALDPYPHGGGISVADCLWMGVPVLAMRRPIPAGRVAASILKVHGLEDWVASDHEAFVSLALAKAADTERLAALRHGLRERVAQSPVGDSRAYASAVEVHYRSIWRDFTNAENSR